MPGFRDAGDALGQLSGTFFSTYDTLETSAACFDRHGGMPGW